MTTLAAVAALAMQARSLHYGSALPLIAAASASHGCGRALRALAALTVADRYVLSPFRRLFLASRAHARVLPTLPTRFS